MPALYPYRIFISHAWKYGDEYSRIVSMLDNAPYFSYYNYSAPQEKPLQLSSVCATMPRSAVPSPQRSKTRRSFS